MSPEFDRYAANYSRLLSDPIRDRFARDPLFLHRRKWLVMRDFFAHRKIDTAALSWLDVGCGQGELLNLAGGNFARAAGCDPSSAMMDSCAGVDVYGQRSPSELLFPDGSFDLVSAVCVYHHVHGGDRALLTESIHRVLRPGGLFCLIEHNPFNPVTRSIVKRCPVDQDAELLTPSAADRLIRRPGFEVIETTYFLYFPEMIFERIGCMEDYFKRLPLGGQFATFFRKSSNSLHEGAA